jgi:hypothetical protein
MPEWEYRTLDLNEGVDVLNDAGDEGWELVIITPNQIAYLKRQVAKPRARSTATKPASAS